MNYTPCETALLRIGGMNLTTQYITSQGEVAERKWYGRAITWLTKTVGLTCINEFFKYYVFHSNLTESTCALLKMLKSNVDDTSSQLTVQQKLDLHKKAVDIFNEIIHKENKGVAEIVLPPLTTEEETNTETPGSPELQEVVVETAAVEEAVIENATPATTLPETTLTIPTTATDFLPQIQIESELPTAKETDTKGTETSTTTVRATEQDSLLSTQAEKEKSIDTSSSDSSSSEDSGAITPEPTTKSKVSFNLAPPPQKPLGRFPERTTEKQPLEYMKDRNTDKQTLLPTKQTKDVDSANLSVRKPLPEAQTRLTSSKNSGSEKLLASRTTRPQERKKALLSPPRSEAPLSPTRTSERLQNQKKKKKTLVQKHSDE